MKYIIFTIALAAGVPFIAFTSTVSSTMKRVFFGLMVVSFLFGSATSINLMSMEYYRGPVRGFEITLADLVAWGLSIGMLLRSGSAIVWRPRFFFPLLAFFLYAAYTVFTADNSILGWFVIWQLLRMGLMYWCTVNFFVTEGVSSKSIRTLVWAYVVTGFLLALITFKQKYVDGIYRAWAFFDHSNTIPSFAVILLCVLLVWLLYDKDVGIWTFLMTLAAALGLIFAIFATGSRTGMVGAGALVVGSLIISNRRNPSLRTKRTTLLILVFMLVGVLFVADTVIDRFMNAPPASEEARNEFELAAIMMADDHKTGVGLNLYSKVLTETRKYREHIAVMRYEEQAGVAHHIYLLTAAEMGYGGMVAFIGLLVLFLGNMVVYGLRWNTLEHRLLLALAMGFAMVCAIGLYEWVLRQSPVLYQTVVALAFGQALVMASSSSGGLSSHE